MNNSRIDDLNYHNDPRNCRANTAPAVEIDGITIMLPTVYTVCHVCRGEGTHVNPSIDAGGLSPDDFHDDPGFEGAYFAGLYDQTCNYCQGLRVVQTPDWDRMTPEQIEAWEEELDSEQAYQAMVRSELMMGC